MGDEPAFMTPFQYIYAGRPDKAVDRVRRLMSINYSTNIAGLPGKLFHIVSCMPDTLSNFCNETHCMSLGNDDSGAMGSFVNWAMLGLVSYYGVCLTLHMFH